MLCYCGSTQAFELCCQPFLAGMGNADSCEQLMRSRYSAYCLRDIDYIYRTYHPSRRADNPKPALATFAANSHFIALNVLSCEQSSQQGYVSFNVRYIQQNVLYEFTERSRFVFEDVWYYLDGVLTDSTPVKINRNAPCPCNSGKKFKQCHQHKLSGSQH